MAIPEKKKAYLKGLGVSDDEIRELEEMNSQTKQVADENHIESKETTEVVEAPVAEVKTEEPAKEAAPVVEAVKEVKDEDKFVTAGQFAEAVAAITKSVTEAITAMSEKIDALNTELKEVKEKESKDGIDPRFIPSTSLAALIAQGMSVIGKDAAKVSKKEAEKSGSPEEAKPNPPQTQSFGNPVVDQVINGIIGVK